MNYWYTADRYFGRESIIKHGARPFKSARHMDAVLLQNLSSKVGPDDVLWIIRDFAFGQQAKDQRWFASLFVRLPGAERLWSLKIAMGRRTKSFPRPWSLT